MAFTQSPTASKTDYALMLKSFLLWTGVLTVCLLIVGFPFGILFVAFGSVIAVALQAVIPGATLWVAIGFVAIQVLGVMAASAMLAIQGIHPHEVSWLRWLSGKANPKHDAVYAACPLTCEIDS